MELKKIEEIDRSTQGEFTRLAITGITCANCSGRIERVLGETSGIFSANVDLASKEGAFEYDSAVISEQGIIEIIEEMGFGVMIDE